MKVLIVDDHALFRVGLQGLLERRGLQVVGAAAEGEEGLRLAETLKPDVVLLDLRMPDLGGLSVLRHICLLYTSPSPRDQRGSRMPSSA